MRKYLLLLLTLGITTTAFSQDFSNKGKDFWVGYGYHQQMTNGGGGSQSMVLYFATDQVTNITVSIPANGYSQTLTSGPIPTVLTSAPIPKTGAQDVTLQAESINPEDKGIHIVSDKPIVAYAHIYNASVSGATILFPTNTLGKEYYSINYDNVSNTDNANCWFYVVACDPGTTTVEITPSAATMNHPANVPFTVDLTQGQIYNVMGQLTETTGSGPTLTYHGVDLTGSKIKSIASAGGSCKRIAVFSGSGRISMSCDGVQSSSDNYMVQSFPKTAWGKKYLTCHTGGNMTNNVYRICVSDPASVVTVNGAVLFGSLINNFYYEIPATNEQLKIESDLPIIVAQYTTSQGECGNGTPGDPEVIYLSPVEQNIAKVNWNATGNFSITQHYFNVVIPNTGTGISSFKLDGVVVNPALFIQHPQDPAYSYLIQSVTAGVHQIQSDSGFNAIAYGFGQAESYGYNAGTNIRDLYNFLTPMNPYSISIDPVACTGTPFHYSVTFPFQPSSLYWDFHGYPLSAPIPNVTTTDPTTILFETYFIGTRQVWHYKLPTTSMYTPAGTYPVTITAGTTTSEGCGNSFERDFELNVYDPPVADFNWTNNGCVSDTVRFNDITTYAPGTYSYKWYWDFGDGNTDIVRNAKHKYASPGTYTVKFAMISNVGCFSDTAVKQVTVTNNPVAAFGFTTPLCAGNTVTISDASTASAPGVLAKWYWNFDDGNGPITALNANDHIITYAPWGPRTVTLTVETSTGCKSEEISHILPVSAVPVAQFTHTQACLPYESVSFVNTSTVADGTSMTYVWDFGDPASGAANSSTATNPTHLYSGTGPYSVKLTATNTGLCTNNTTVSIIDIYAQAHGAFTVNPENCLHDPTVFTSTSTGSGAAISEYYWDFGDASPVSNVQNPSHIYGTAGTKTIKHWVKTVNGCFSDTIQHTVIINPLPTVDFNFTTPSCETRTINFSDVSIANAGTVTDWSWDFDDIASGAANFSTLQNPTHTFATAGTYVVKLTVTTSKGCVSSFDKTVTINARPQAGFIVPEVCLNDTYAQFTDTSHIAAGSVTNWQWNFGDPNANAGNPNVSNLQNPTHSYSATGSNTVQLIVTSALGCKDTISHVLFINGSFPVANFTVNNTVFCANDSIRITNASTVFPGVVTKLEIYWDNVGQPAVFETDDAPVSGGVYSHLYPNFQSPLTKDFVIRLRAYSGGVCVNDKYQTITVNAAPKVQFNAIPNACLNVAPYQLTQASEIGTVPGSAVFTGPGVSSSGMFDPLAVGPGLYTIHYYYTSNFGCIDSAIQQVRVLEAPVAKFGFGNPACEKQTLLFTDTSSTTVGTLTTWTWDFGDGTLPEIRNNADPFTHTFAAAGTYQVKLFVTTSDGCKSVVKQRDVEIAPLPKPNFSFADTSCLPNATIQFTNLSTIANGTENAFTYAWNFGDPASGLANTSTLQTPSHHYLAVGPYNVKLEVTSGAHCVYDTVIVLNSIHPQPKADFNFDKPSVCIGDNVIFHDLSDGKDGAVAAWTWSFGDNQTSSLQDPSHTYANTGLYNVSLYSTNSFGCNSDTVSKPYNVYPYPVVDAGPDRFILEGGSAVIHPVVSGNDLQYEWIPNMYLDNYHILSPTCTPLQDIIYTLKVTASGGCPATDKVSVKVLPMPKIPNTFSPNNDGINDLWDIQYLDTYPTCRVQVFTRTGQLVFESRGYRTPWDGTMKGKSLPVDTYYYIIEPENGREPVTGFVTIIK